MDGVALFSPAMAAEMMFEVSLVDWFISLIF
jgi:hypothetical protein